MCEQSYCQGRCQLRARLATDAHTWLAHLAGVRYHQLSAVVQMRVKLNNEINAGSNVVATSSVKCDVGFGRVRQWLGLQASYKDHVRGDHGAADLKSIAGLHIPVRGTALRSICCDGKCSCRMQRAGSATITLRHDFARSALSEQTWEV